MHNVHHIIWNTGEFICNSLYLPLEMWQETFVTISKLRSSTSFKMKLSFNIWEYFSTIPFQNSKRYICKSHLHTIPIFRFICLFILFWLNKCFITMTHKVLGRYETYESSHLSPVIQDKSFVKFLPPCGYFPRLFPPRGYYFYLFPPYG